MDAYEVVKTIGHGSFGKVAKIIRKKDNKIFVWKELDFGRMTDKEKQLIVSEVNILRGFKHPYIVRYYDRIIDQSAYKIYIIMEHCGNGDLSALIRKNKQAGVVPEERHVWRVALQLCLALEQCHTRKEGKILHRDIKPANILLDRDNNVRLGDFGLARVLSDQSVLAHSNVGTPYYMSPEQIRDQAYDERSDMWGVGCVLYEYSQNRPPFEATNQLQLARKIESGSYREIVGYSEELVDVIALCLTADPAQRPSVEQLLALPSLSFRLREKKLSNHWLELKRKEDELAAREEGVAAREEQASAHEYALRAREAEAASLLAELRARERLLEQREEALLGRPCDRAAGGAEPASPDADDDAVITITPVATPDRHRTRDATPESDRLPPHTVTPPSRYSSGSSSKPYSSQGTPSMQYPKNFAMSPKSPGSPGYQQIFLQQKEQLGSSPRAKREEYAAPPGSTQRQQDAPEYLSPSSAGQGQGYSAADHAPHDCPHTPHRQTCRADLYRDFSPHTPTRLPSRQPPQPTPANFCSRVSQQSSVGTPTYTRVRSGTYQSKPIFA
ncbi:putative serine/threonine-protein kinase nek2 [Diplonema papillatum]|nr:putative serine/threonine-protein kinase nek2 [Diplonema papillatum]